MAGDPALKTLHKLWHFGGHINLTLGIIILMVLDLLAGYTPLKHHNDLFTPINDIGFYKWAGTYGINYSEQTAWLFILVGLLAALAINTFICTTDRVVVLVKRKNSVATLRGFILRFGPHVMHYSMLIMLTGYLISYLTAGTHMGKILLPGKTISINHGECSISLTKLSIAYYQGDRLLHMENRAIDVRALLTITGNGKTKTGILGFNRPVRFSPFSIHLKNFAPKTNGGMERRKYINVIIKNDPGKSFYFTGMLLFTLGLIMYLGDKMTGTPNRVQQK